MTKKKIRKMQKKMIKKQMRRQRRRKAFKFIFAVAACLVLVIAVSGFFHGRVSWNAEIPDSKINSEKHWALDDLIPQIKSLWIYGYDILFYKCSSV